MPVQIIPGGYTSPTESEAYRGDSKSAIERKRKIAQSLIAQATEYQPSAHWATAIAKGLQGLVGGYQASQADKAESDINRRVAEALKGGSLDEMKRVGLETGALDPSDLIKAQISQNDPWAKNLFSATDPQGHPVLLQASGTGEVRQAPGGYGPANPVTYVQGPTQATPSLRYGGAPAAAEADIPPIAKDIAGATTQKEQAQNRVEAQNLLPEQLQSFDTAEKQINAIVDDENLPYAFGQFRAHPVNRAMGEIPEWAGGRSQGVANLQSRVEALKGSAFLTAYMGLKGGGQISNVEGDKATKAQVRLNNAQSPEDVKAALQEMKDLMQGKLEVTITRARGAGLPQGGAGRGAHDLSTGGQAQVQQHVARARAALRDRDPNAVLEVFKQQTGLDDATARQMLGM